MLPIKILAHIAKISDTNIALNIILAFNIRETDEFIDMLVIKHDYGHHYVYRIRDVIHYRHGPAIMSSNGVVMWCQRGLPHREDNLRNVLGNEDFRNPGPAIEYPSGRKEWWQNGKRHRTNGPAIEGPSGIKEWYQNGERLYGVVGNEYL